MSTEAVSEIELHSFVDGRLNAARSGEIAAWLESHPAEAKAVQGYININRQLRQLHDSVLDEAMPRRMLQARHRGVRNVFAKVAGIAALLVIGSGAGWLARGQMENRVSPSFTQSMLHQALSAHAVYTPEKRHAVEVVVEEEEHLVRWLSKRFGAKIQAPKLNEIGFELLGGRMLPDDFNPAAQFMYQDASGRRLTLFVRKSRGANQDTAFRFARRDDTNAFYWIEGDLGYTLIGDIEKPMLSQAARKVYDQLEM